MERQRKRDEDGFSDGEGLEEDKWRVKREGKAMGVEGKPREEMESERQTFGCRGDGQEVSNDLDVLTE